MGYFASPAPVFLIAQLLITTTAAAGIHSCRVNNKLLINIIWAVALLPDPTKTLRTPAAAAARARHVGVFGAAVLNRLSKYTAEEIFHVGAGLAMLGFKPPRTLQADYAGEGSRTSITTFGGLIERRSIKVMHYLSPKAVSDAGFVAARLVAPGDMSAEWLKLFAHVRRIGSYSKTSQQSQSYVKQL